MAAEAFGWPEVAVQWVQWLDAGPALGLPMPAPRRLAEPERVEMPLSWEEYRATAKVVVGDESRRMSQAKLAPGVATIEGAKENMS